MDHAVTFGHAMRNFRDIQTPGKVCEFTNTVAYGLRTILLRHYTYDTKYT